jgi:hypothetical protein
MNRTISTFVYKCKGTDISDIRCTNRCKLMTKQESPVAPQRCMFIVDDDTIVSHWILVAEKHLS